jgi:hypothetical protein
MKPEHQTAYLDFADAVEAALLSGEAPKKGLATTLAQLRQATETENAMTGGVSAHTLLAQTITLADKLLSPLDENSLMLFHAQMEAEKALANESFREWVFLNMALRAEAQPAVGQLFINQLLPDDHNTHRKALERLAAHASNLQEMGKSRGIDPRIISASETGPLAAFDARRIFFEPLNEGTHAAVRYDVDQGMAAAKVMAVLPVSEIEGQALNVVDTARTVFYEGGSGRSEWSDLPLCANPREGSIEDTVRPLANSLRPLTIMLDAVAEDDPAVQHAINYFHVLARDPKLGTEAPVQSSASIEM